MPIFKFIRAATKPLILIAERLFNTKPIQRDATTQQAVDSETANMAMYQYYGCPFCMITRRAVRRLNLDIEYRDALNDTEHKQALAHEGGKEQVPCLRIEQEGKTTWMYESRDIVAYLDNKFGEAA